MRANHVLCLQTIELMACFLSSVYESLSLALWIYYETRHGGAANATTAGQTSVEEMDRERE